MIKLFLQEVKDLIVRDNFFNLEKYLKTEPILKGNFKFFTYTFNAAASNLVIEHGFGFTPKDVILLSATNSATITFHYDSFTKTTIKVSSSAASVIRAFIGRYED